MCVSKVINRFHDNCKLSSFRFDPIATPKQRKQMRKVAATIDN